MRDAFVRTVCLLAKENKDIYVLVGDIGTFTFDPFRGAFPKRFLNMGIAEANMMGVSAGLALSGKIPFVYTIAPFVTMRCFEQIRVDVCYQNLNVKVVGVGTGLAYSTLGPTHQTVEDIAIMRALPNMTIISPADPLETEKVTRAVVEYQGPVYIRLAKSGEPVIYESDYEYKIGKGVILKDGEDITFIATGVAVYNAIIAADKLSKEGISVRLINMHTLKPLDSEIIIKSANETGAIITIEEHSIIGGLGSGVSEVISEQIPKKILFQRVGLLDTFSRDYGTHEQIQALHKLSPEYIVDCAKRLLKTICSSAGTLID